MLNKVKYAMNWMSFHLGGLRGDCLFSIGTPMENAILDGIFEN